MVLETPYCQTRAGPLCCFLMTFVKGVMLLRDKAVIILFHRNPRAFSPPEGGYSRLRLHTPVVLLTAPRL